MSNAFARRDVCVCVCVCVRERERERAEGKVFPFFPLFFCNSPQWVRASSFTRFLDHTHTHNDAPQSVGLLWTSDQLFVKTPT